MTSPIQVLGAEIRESIQRDHDGREARAVVATRSYPTSSKDLWDALTNPERIPRWFLPISGNLELGGKYQLEGNAGGTITKCEPPRLLSVTWEMAGDVSWVTVTLTPQSDDETLLHLEHLAHVAPDFWNQYGPGATGVGWDLALMGLGQFFEDQPVVTPENSAEWLASDTARAFIRQSCDAWRVAAIEGGEEPAQAEAAARQTHAFYTGEPIEDESS